MSKMSITLVGLLSVIVSTHASEQNLLRNIELRKNSQEPATISEWTVTSQNPVESEEIVAFQGLADAMFFFKGKAGAKIRQKNLKIKPGTWYVMSAWYKNLSKRDQKNPYGLYLGASTPNGGDWDSFYYKCFGMSEKWVKLRAFFNSGERTEMDFFARIFGDGEWALGRLVLRELKDSDYYSKFVVDGDFELDQLGGIPIDFRKTGKLSLDPIVEENDGFPTGTKNMAVKVSPKHPLSLVGPSFIASENDLVKLSIWAKADKPGATLGLSVSGDKFLKRSGAALTQKWRKFELETKMPSSGKYFIEGPRLLEICLNATADGDNSIRFDNVVLKTMPEKKSVRKKTGNNLLIMNSSFEAGFAGWEWIFAEPVSDHNEGGNVSIDMNTAAEGTCSLRIKIPKSETKTSWHLFRLRSACFDAPALESYNVTFWAKADQKGAKCAVRMFYGNGGDFYLDKEWKRYQGKVVPTKDKQGKNTLMFECPLNGGTYWFDGIQLSKSKQATSVPQGKASAEKMPPYEPDGKLEIGGVIPDRIYPFFVDGDEVKADVYFCSRFDSEKTYDFSWEAIDYRREVVATHSSKVTIPANKTIKKRLPLFSALKGQFIINFKLEDPETKTVAESPLVYGIFPEPKNVDPKESWFGILPGSLNCGRRGNPTTFYALKGGSYDRQMKTLKFCGFNWVRTFAAGNWANTELEKGKFEWKFDKSLKTMRDNHLRIYTVIGGYYDFPKWSDSGRKFDHVAKYGRVNYPKISDWKDYAVAYAKHYKGTVDAATIMSETQYSVDEYFDLVKALCPAIKEVAPELKIALPGFPCQALPWDDKDDTWIGRLMKKGLYNYLDIYHGHFYLKGHAHGLEGVRKEPFESAINGKYGTKVEEFERQVKYFRKTYGDKPIWDSESGTIFNASVPWMEIPPMHLTFDWYTPEVSAARMVRWGIIRMAAGIQRHMYFMFSLPFMHNYHCLDIVNYNMSPRVGLPALSQFARRLDVTKFKKQVKVGMDTWMYVFEDGTKTIAVYWNYSLENKERSKITLPLVDADILAEDMMGNPVKVDSKDGYIVLPLGCSPIYVVSHKLNSGQMADAFKKAKVIDGCACKLRVTPGNVNGKAGVVAGVFNLSMDALKNVKLNVELPSGWTTNSNTLVFEQVESLKEATLGASLKDLCDAPEKEINVSGIVNDKEYKAQSGKLFLASFPKAHAPIQMDGKVEEGEYGKEKAVVLDQPSQLLERVRSEGLRPILKSWLDNAKPVTAKIRSCWTPNALYVGCKVKDPDVINTQPIGKLFAGDCIEVYLDFAPEADLFSDNYEDHQIKLVFAPANGEYPARFQVEAMGKPIDTFKYIPLDQIKVVSESTSDGYELEVEIPLRNISLNADRIIGFNAQVIGFTPNVGKPYALMWNGKQSWDNPRNFGFAILK